jgi:hypothetical protein
LQPYREAHITLVDPRFEFRRLADAIFGDTERRFNTSSMAAATLPLACGVPAGWKKTLPRNALAVARQLMAQV